MSKSVQTLSTENPSSSVQATKIDDQKMQEKKALLSKENSLETKMKRFESIEKELDQIFIDDQDHNTKADENLNYVKKKLKQVKSLVSRYEKQQGLEKHPSFSGQQQLSEDQEFPKMSEDWQKLSVENHILASPMMNNLLLGYALLETDLRICLLSFAVFPEKAIIKRKPLIYWWMAEGFIKKSDEKSVEEVGESFFTELINKGIIQRRSKNENTPRVDSCTLHPWIRRMLISKARQAEIFDFDKMGIITCSVTDSRCLCFPMDDKGSSSDSFWKREFWTMFNVNESYLSFKEDFLTKFNKVKILQLGSWKSSLFHHIEVENDKFLNDLGALKHLKYLSLRGISRITTLPSSITECRNLEILDLKGCHTLESLPSDFGSLRKLTHLDFSECYLLENLPNNQHKLLLLQVLKGFDADKYSSSAHTIYKSLDAFRHLENLRKLSVLIGTKRSIEQLGDLKWLFSIKNLRILTLTWRTVSTKHDEQSKEEEEMWNLDLEIQQVNEWAADKNQYGNLENLEKLDLRCFPFRKRPIWLSPSILKNLKRLYVTGGQLEDPIDAGNTRDHWGKVDILRLKYLENLKLASDQVVRLFPDLSYFEMTVSPRSADEKHDVVSWRKDHQGWGKFPQFPI